MLPHQTVELTSFITQALSPAVAISATGLLIMGLHNRISVLGGRVRQLNREMLQSREPAQVENIRTQVVLFLQRARVVRNALFLLYAAMGLMVLTAFAIALGDLGILPSALNLPVVSFLLGLLLVFIATVMEAREVSLNLETLMLDTDYAFKNHLPADGGKMLE